MARTDTLLNFLTDVAAAIRAKKGSSEAIFAASFDTEIQNLPSGGSGSGDDTLEKLISRTITSVTVPDSVTSVGSGAFYACTNLNSVSLPNAITTIQQYAFFSCSALQNITLPGALKIISNNAFESCTKLTGITVPNSVTNIGSYAFATCSALSSITLGSNLTYLGNKAFRNDTALTEITLPESLKTLSGCFTGCKNLKTVDCTASTSVIVLGATDCFQNCHADLQIKVPAALLDSWKTATNWATIADKIVGV